MREAIHTLVAALFFVASINGLRDFVTAGNGKPVHLGSVKVEVKKGSIPLAYPEKIFNDLEATKRILNIIERVRPLFPYGIYTMPPLDPLKRKNLPPLNLHGRATLLGNNFVLVGAQRFQLNSLELRTQYDFQSTFRADFNVSFPGLHAGAEVVIDLSPMIPIKVKLFVAVALENLSVVGALSGTEVPDGSSFVRATGAFANVLAEDVSIFLNPENTLIDLLKKFPDLQLEFDKSFVTNIGQMAADVVLNLGNTILRGFDKYTLQDILGLTGSQDFKPLLLPGPKLDSNNQKQ